MIFTVFLAIGTIPRLFFAHHAISTVKNMIRIAALLAVVFSTFVGCRQSMTTQDLLGNRLSPAGGQSGFPSGLTGNQFANQTTPGQMNELSKQIDALNSRVARFNSDNDNLHTQVAALQQRLQNANNYNDQLKQQLSDTTIQLQQLQRTAQQSLASQSSRGTPTQFAGATIRANNSLMGKLDSVQQSGLKSWMDGDVIRIEAPTDRIFVPGSYQINANDAAALANLANIIRLNFPRQVVGIEAHWDGTPIQPASTSHHQLTATQALAVFDLLVKSGLPNNQVFTMALGSNRPRYNVAVQNGISPNRRIEIVIYPETFN